MRHVQFIRVAGMLLLALSSILLCPAARAQEKPTPPEAAQALAKAASAEEASPLRPAGFSSEERAELAKRAEDPGPAVAGGSLSNEHLTYIVIALAAAVIVLIAK